MCSSVAHPVKGSARFCQRHKVEKGLGWDGWANVSELLIIAVNLKKRKPLICCHQHNRFDQKVQGQMSCFSIATHGYTALGEQAVPKSFLS